MAQRASEQMIYDHVKKYIKILQENNISIWRLYMFGSHTKGTARPESDIDLAVFLDQDEIDDFDADIQLLRMTRNVNLSIEPHSFSRKDFENPDPFVQEIIRTGERIV